LVSACFKETFLAVKADFVVSYKNDNKAIPVRVLLNNITEGGESYRWTFEGAAVGTSTEKNPPEILYTKAGKYKIILEASNADNQKDKKEIEVTIGEAVQANFEMIYDVNNFAPAKVNFKNKSTGATRYEWSFEKADISTSTLESPTVNFATEGLYNVSLRAYNGNVFVSKDSTISIKAGLVPNFDYSAIDFNFNAEAPLTIRAVNTSKGSTSIKWSVADATAKIKTDTDSVTTITLSEAKKYIVKLTTSNGKQTKTFEKEITVNPNTNLIFLENVKLGIDNESAIPNYFASRRNQGLDIASLDTLSYGNEIDVVFFSRDEDFSYGRFVSPNAVSALLLKKIPNGQNTTFINQLESCAACTKVTDVLFNNLKTAKDFEALTFKFEDSLIEGFNQSTVPRYVPFKTYNNRLGIIKIKKFVKDGPDSYILADIKVFRKP
jgi:PKD repeat protein